MEEIKQDVKKVDNKKIMAAIAYILFFIPLLTEDKNDPFVKYHVKQGLLIFIGWAIIMLIGPLLYGIIKLLNLCLIILMVIGIVNAVNGKETPLPIVGKFADYFKF